MDVQSVLCGIFKRQFKIMSMTARMELQERDLKIPRSLQTFNSIEGFLTLLARSKHIHIAKYAMLRNVDLKKKVLVHFWLIWQTEHLSSLKS